MIWNLCINSFSVGDPKDISYCFKQGQGLIKNHICSETFVTVYLYFSGITLEYLFLVIFGFRMKYMRYLPFGKKFAEFIVF